MPSADYERIADLLPSEPGDYWDFPSCVLAFGESLRGSSLARVGPCLFRKRGAEYTLATWKGDAKEMERVFVSLRRRRATKVKDVGWSEDKLAGLGDGALRLVSPVADFHVTDAFDFEFTEKRRHTRTKLRRVLADGAIGLCTAPAERTTPERVEVFQMFERWKQWAQMRHFMVFVGHYLAWLRRFYIEPNNCELRVHRDRSTGEVVGLFGFERVGRAAQVNIVKHAPSRLPLARFLWLDGLRAILAGGASRVFCGTTADGLKVNLGMESRRAFRLKART